MYVFWPWLGAMHSLMNTSYPQFPEPPFEAHRTMVAGVVGVHCKALVASCQKRRSLRETKGERFQNRNGTPFSGSVVAKMRGFVRQLR
jgi:hypothetical protein